MKLTNKCGTYGGESQWCKREGWTRGKQKNPPGEATTSGPDEISTGPLFPHPPSFDGSIRPVSYSYEMQVRL